MLYAVVRTQFVGWHCWPEAPEHRSYLRSMHRHVFHVTVTVPQRHNDRDVEYHDLLDQVSYVCMDLPSSETQSCEMMAEEIARRLGREAIEVAVMEDGEAGAVYDNL